jgi:hypothetical protein
LERRLEALERAAPGLALLTAEEATFVSNVKKLRVAVERGWVLLWQRANASTSSSKTRSSLNSSPSQYIDGRGSGADDWGGGSDVSSSGSSSSSSSGSGGNQAGSRAGSRRSGREVSNVHLDFVADKTSSSARIVFELMKSGQLWDKVLPAAVRL